MTMVHKMYFLLFFAVLFPTFVFSQSQMVKGLGEDWSDERGWSIIATYDNGYAIAGSSLGDAFIVKFDEAYNVIWSKALNSGSGSGELAASLIETSDSSFVFTGFTSNYPQDDMLLAKFSKKGDFCWARAFRYGSWMRGSNVIETIDKGFATANIWGINVIKLDSSGTVQWGRNIDGVETVSLVQISDSGYVLAGYTGTVGAGGDDCVLLKYDYSGALEWARAFGGSDGERAGSVARTLDNGYIVVGGTASFPPNIGTGNFLIVKFDSVGNYLWAKSVGESWGSSNDGASAVCATNDSGFVVVGTTARYGPGNVLLTKFNAQNNYEWGYVIDATWGSSVVQTHDNGYAVTGLSDYGVANFYLAKYDSSGETCLGIPAYWTVVNDVQCSITVFAPTVNSLSPTMVSTDFVASDVVFPETFMCMNDITPPVIDSTTVWPDTTYSGPFEVKTYVTDAISGVDSVLLFYKRDEDADWVTNYMHDIGNWYYDTIPAAGTISDTIRYYIWANDCATPANSASDPANAPTVYYSFVANVPGIEEYQQRPAEFSCSVNSPARQRVMFRLSLPEPSVVSLRIYDVLGRLVGTQQSGAYAAGYHDILFEPKHGGVYFYQLESTASKSIKKGKIIIF